MVHSLNIASEMKILQTQIQTHTRTHVTMCKLTIDTTTSLF